MSKFYFTSKEAFSLGFKLIAAFLLLSRSQAFAQTDQALKLAPNLPRQETKPI
jgi:hypothetical protein